MEMLDLSKANGTKVKLHTLFSTLSLTLILLLNEIYVSLIP